MSQTQSSTTLTAIKRQLDVVLEETLHAIVSETLAELDEGYEPGG